MHKKMVDEIVAVCRERFADGDCAKENPFTVEQLEGAIIELVGTAHFSSEIAASHPTILHTDAAYKADSMAMKLVGERHEKRDLVNLVRWLILDKAKLANIGIYP